MARRLRKDSMLSTPVILVQNTPGGFTVSYQDAAYPGYTLMQAAMEATDMAREHRINTVAYLDSGHNLYLFSPRQFVELARG